MGSLIPVVAGDARAASQVLNCFLQLVEDEIWGVRKACCDSLVDISKYLSPELRTSRLVPLFERLTDDQSRWVRNAAFQNLGPFIATFTDGRVDPKLLMFFRTMPHPSKHGRDGDIALYCAHSFPAVLQAVGGARWGELSDLYLLLVKDLQWKVRKSEEVCFVWGLQIFKNFFSLKVRKTLAHSLHEVARLVGQQVAERTLCTIFEAFLQDIEEVKLGVVTNLAAFLAVLGPECRAQYAQTVKDLREDFGGWRFREMVGGQLAQLCLLFSGRELREVIVPACLGLCRDPVLTVRESAVTGVAALTARLRGDSTLLPVPGDANVEVDAAKQKKDEEERAELYEALQQDLQRLAKGSFHDRKTFAQVCGAFLGIQGISEAGRKGKKPNNNHTDYVKTMLTVPLFFRISWSFGSSCQRYYSKRANGCCPSPC